jgi:MerR family transcriptional regulator, light-induced transcriptional regulator
MSILLDERPVTVWLSRRGKYPALAFREGLAMTNNMEWDRRSSYDLGLERLRTFTQPLSPALSPDVANPDENHLQEFAAVIENVIVPRLLMAHSVNRKTVLANSEVSQRLDVAKFVDLTIHEDPELAIDFVRREMESGVLFENILLNLLAPAARALGERWEQDLCSFVEVTLGVARMHRMLREFNGIPPHLWSQAGSGRNMLLLPAPGEQHTFGLRLVQEFLMRDSWTVVNRPCKDFAELVTVLKSEHFDVVGLSLSGETLIDTLMSCIAVVRSYSKNRRVHIIVGGQLFSERPELINTCGADAYAADAPSTVRVVNGWASALSSLT